MTAYIILYINSQGRIYDAQVASAFPVTQTRDAGTQVMLSRARGADYEEAVRNVLAEARDRTPWVLKHDRISRQAIQ